MNSTGLFILKRERSKETPAYIYFPTGLYSLSKWPLNHRVGIGTFLCLLIGIFLLSSCERSHVIPLKTSEYRPQLTIHGMAGPERGAEVLVQFSEPRNGEQSTGPDLPPLEVFLLKSQHRHLQFQQKSAGRFFIPPDDFYPDPGVGYAIEVVLPESEESYISEISILPEKPDLRSVRAVPDERYESYYALEIRLGPVNSPVSAVAVFPVPLDSLGQAVTKIYESNDFEITPWQKIRSDVTYFNSEIWSEKTLLYRKYRTYTTEEGQHYLADSVDLYVSYLSEELSSFTRDLSEIYFDGDDIFKPVRPVYSNFDQVAGVFGMYHEVEVRVKMEK